MGSLRIQKRWPNNAERYRVEIHETANDARTTQNYVSELLERLKEAVRDYDKVLIAQIISDLQVFNADTKTMLSDIQRFATAARFGAEEKPDQGAQGGDAGEERLAT